MPFLVYVVALAIAAGTLALSVNLVTSPDFKPVGRQIAATADVRQIPIGKSSIGKSSIGKSSIDKSAIDKPSNVSPGDPHNQLTPVYPAAPGKDLSARELPAAADSKGAAREPEKSTEAATAQAAATTDGAATMASASAAASNSCAIAACSSTYRSFRASDCTYQPFEGPRKICALDTSGIQDASLAPPASASRDGNAVSRPRAPSRVGELDEVERVVRRLPVRDDYVDARGERIVVIERPGYRYNRQPYIIYQER